jgi:hypothetical protein
MKQKPLKALCDERIFWMIREKKTGLYFKGTRWVIFRQKGRMYFKLTSLMRALKRLTLAGAVANLEVVEFKVKESAVCEALDYGE